VARAWISYLPSNSQLLSPFLPGVPCALWFHATSHSYLHYSPNTVQGIKQQGATEQDRHSMDKAPFCAAALKSDQLVGFIW